MSPSPDRAHPEQVWPFRIDPPWATALRPFGVREGRAQVVLTDDALDVRFGRFHVRAPWADVAGACATGPFRWYRAIGPRLSLADRGATFGSSTTGGTCITFHRPVAALFGRRRVHPGLTVTVADPEGLRDAIDERLAAGR